MLDLGDRLPGGVSEIYGSEDEELEHFDWMYDFCGDVYRSVREGLKYLGGLFSRFPV